MFSHWSRAMLWKQSTNAHFILHLIIQYPAVQKLLKRCTDDWTLILRSKVSRRFNPPPPRLKKNWSGRYGLITKVIIWDWNLQKSWICSKFSSLQHPDFPQPWPLPPPPLHQLHAYFTENNKTSLATIKQVYIWETSNILLSVLW